MLDRSDPPLVELTRRVNRSEARVVNQTVMKRLLCLQGAVLVGISAFCPIMGVPIFGSISYIQRWPYAASALLATAVLACTFAVFGAIKWAWLPGVVALCIAAYTIYQFRAKLAATERHLGANLAGNPFAGLAHGLVHTVQLQWGVGVLIIGGVLLVVAAYIPGDLHSPSSLRMRSRTGG